MVVSSVLGFLMNNQNEDTRINTPHRPTYLNCYLLFVSLHEHQTLLAVGFRHGSAEQARLQGKAELALPALFVPVALEVVALDQAPALAPAAFVEGAED